MGRNENKNTDSMRWISVDDAFPPVKYHKVNEMTYSKPLLFFDITHDQCAGFHLGEYSNTIEKPDVFEWVEFEDGEACSKVIKEVLYWCPLTPLIESADDLVDKYWEAYKRGVIQRFQHMDGQRIIGKLREEL